MAFDAHKNGAYGTVLTAPSPADSGTTLVLHSGEGALFPSPTGANYNCTVWPVGVRPIFAGTGRNAEIARVSVLSTDTFTIARAQEGTTARSIVVGDQFALTITAKSITDIEAAVAPAKLIAHLNDTVANMPTGWVEATAIRGYTIVGMPASGTKAGTVGTALTNLQDKTHTHTGPSHTHTGPSHTHTLTGSGAQYGQGTGISGGPNDVNGQLTGGANAGGTGATGADGTGATGTAPTSGVMPYIQYPAMEKS